MAEKRMFTKKITESDAFLDMPLSSQCLYFHLNMSADDDGFVNNPKRIQRLVGASNDDMRILLAKGFIIAFESGVIVIKHWKMHNYIQNDRYKPTDYQEEASMLKVKENKAYTISDANLDTKCIQNVLVDKNSIDKSSIDKNNKIYSSACAQIIDYLNLKVGTNYRNNGRKTTTLIVARLKEGFTVDDFKKVIDIKSSQWLRDLEMSKYLRPETLFGNKFEGYLNERGASNGAGCITGNAKDNYGYDDI